MYQIGYMKCIKTDTQNVLILILLLKRTDIILVLNVTIISVIYY